MRHFRIVCRFPLSICSTITLISTTSAWTSHRQYSFVSAVHPGLMNKTSFITALAAHQNGVNSLTTITNTADLSKPNNEESDSKQDTSHPLHSLWNHFDHSWIKHLSPETPENRIKSQKTAGATDDGHSNNVKRPVFNGHYVPVRPLALKNPRLVIHSPDMATRLGFSPTDVHSPEFTLFFSGDVDRAFHAITGGTTVDDKIATWATPYALSIMGTRYTSNCPYGTGDGYGDGRAISIGEVLSPSDLSHDGLPQRYELQLKGAGPTPFCRGADGRAVYRSSIREFLASEAMHHLNISTTRALSLILSDGVSGDKVNRPWYSEDSKRQGLPDIQDPRLSQYSLEDRKMILAQLKAQIKNDPNIMIQEPCAITCRVSPSFVRVGHIDLFARRATRDLIQEDAKPNINSAEFHELEQLLWHACYREFPSQCYHPFHKDNDVASASKALLENSLENISTLVANWIRVGFVQGNFNADNCLIAGRTMDYGPFGWVDEYHPLYAKWTGSGDHFGFMNQAKAGYVNWAVLVASVMPLIEGYSENIREAQKYKDELMSKGQKIFEEKVSMTFRSKLGFHPRDVSADELWESLEPLLLVTRVDWTLFWRRLMLVARNFPLHIEAKDYEEMFQLLNGDENQNQGSSPFYSPLEENDKIKYIQWIQSWREALEIAYASDGTSIRLSQSDEKPLSAAERMRISNPKYILREHLLVEAYSKAYAIKSSFFASLKNEPNDESKLFELYDLIQNPYDEGDDNQDRRFFRRTPDSALSAGGTAFMS